MAYGAHYPYILRRQEADEDSYILIGCAFIEELNNGEALDLVEAGKLAERTICLV